jgi:hypothetical protein
MTKAFELFRYHNADGTAREWGYSNRGGGVAEIRWGRAGALRQGHEKPLREAMALSQQKERKGYHYVGAVWLDDQGSHTVGPSAAQHAPPAAPRAPREPPVTRQPQPQPKRKPVDIAELLGGGDGEYF